MCSEPNLHSLLLVVVVNVQTSEVCSLRFIGTYRELVILFGSTTVQLRRVGRYAVEIKHH